MRDKLDRRRDPAWLTYAKRYGPPVAVGLLVGFILAPLFYSSSVRRSLAPTTSSDVSRAVAASEHVAGRSLKDISTLPLL